MDFILIPQLLVGREASRPLLPPLRNFGGGTELSQPELQLSPAQLCPPIPRALLRTKYLPALAGTLEAAFAVRGKLEALITDDNLIFFFPTH